MNLYDKIYYKIATLSDQEEALKSSLYAYLFARLGIPGTDIKKCQEVACTDPVDAFYFALYIPGANIEYCQEAACKDPYDAYCFARDIPGADIEYCRKACESDPEILKEFDQMITEMAIG